MIKTVLFDMNETLLNLSLLNNNFRKYFDNDFVIKYWFTKILHSSTVMGAMNEYKNFGLLADAALESVFQESNKTLTDEIKKDILGSFRHLAPYDDVIPALKRLHKRNIRTIAVSNSSLEMIKEQLSNASIIDLFDNYYSVDATEKYKPFTDIYHYVVKQEGIDTTQTAMVATHDWDLFGAKKAGLTTAYIARSQSIYNPCYQSADLVADDLDVLAQQLINFS